ncbi:unnamed protein product [Soboliphyme baturini]|uniref:PGG domain-containing protein n=1 Tax=Soboliphyme baturini TaxID=241478 RepID=A0A183IG20_9BILA|nr:unnamed protein product [Soboliphyme baturini]
MCIFDLFTSIVVYSFAMDGCDSTFSPKRMLAVSIRKRRSFRSSKVEDLRMEVLTECVIRQLCTQIEKRKRRLGGAEDERDAKRRAITWLVACAVTLAMDPFGGDGEVSFDERLLLNARSYIKAGKDQFLKNLVFSSIAVMRSFVFQAYLTCYLFVSD